MNKNVKHKIRFLIYTTFAFCTIISHASAISKEDIVLTQQMKETRISINSKNKSLDELLTEICKQTNFSYAFDSTIKIDPNLKYSLQVSNVTIEQAVLKLLSSTPYVYVIKDGQIIITKKRPIEISNEKIKISGLVIDGTTKKPIVGATVIATEEGDGAISDEKGGFTITTQKGVELEVSYVGYKLKIVEAKSSLVIEMEIDVVAVDEVIVTGIFRKSAESFTGSAVTVTEKELKQYGNRNILTTLRNIDPSFNVVVNNDFGSNPNKIAEVRIRGNSSIPNVDVYKNEANVALLQDDARSKMNTPLVIIDGFESTLQRMIDMNENEIALITLLKDASATAIYGSRGANGVIVIETKVPKMGKLRVTYRGDVDFEIPDLTSYSLLNAREKLQLEYEVGRFNSSAPITDLYYKKAYYYLLNEVNSGVDTYWLSKPLGTGIGHRHNVRIDGGDKTFRYSASAQCNNTQGVMKNSSRTIFNGTIALSYYYKNLKFTNTLIVGIIKSNETPYGNFSDYVNMNPYFRSHDKEGNILKLLGSNDYSRMDKTARQNPLYNATLNRIDENKTNMLTNNFSIDWTLFENLIVKGRFGITQSLGSANQFIPAEHTMFEDYDNDAMILRRGRQSVSNSEAYDYDGSINISYSKQFREKHQLYAGLDYNIRQSNYSSYSIKAEGFSNSNLNFLPMALQYETGGKPSGSESLSRAIGMTGSINYTYDNRYYVDLSGRIDGSSAFGVNNRFAPFWSTGLGWNIHNEMFMKASTIFSLLKVRGSVGITGSQNFNSYQALSTYRYYTDDRYFKWTGSYLMGLGNDKLKWQHKLNYNIGIDAKLFENRLSIVADYYIEKTKNLISSVEIPLSQGYSSYTENVGSMENRGMELKATVVVVQRNDWFFNIGGAMISNRNKITKISEALKEAQKNLENRAETEPSTLYREGYSTSSIWVIPSLGIDPSDGKELFVDKYGRVTDQWDAANLAYCGLSEPKYQGNLNTMLRYKKFSLALSFGYRLGGQIYNSTLVNKVENVNYNYNLDSRVYTDRWRNVGDRVHFKSTKITEKTYKSSRFVQDENTLNCQNITFMYEINSEKLTKKLGVEYVTLSASVADLFYISSVKRERGIVYPFSRQTSITLNVAF